MPYSTVPRTDQPQLSVVVPVYNEAGENLRLLVERVTSVLDNASISFELIFVNDGSGEVTSTVLHELATTTPRVRLVVLSRNYGECAAICAGLDNALGAAVVNMDSDLQDPPEMIPTMFEYYRQGYDIIFTRQASRQDSVSRQLTAALFYRLLRASTSVDVPLDAGEFRLMSRRAVDALRAFPEKRRFLRGLVPALGFKQMVLPFDRQARTCGQSEYTLSKLLALAIEGFLTLSFSPLVLLAMLGCALMVGGIAVLCLSALTVVGCLLVCCGVNVIACSVVGAYVAMTLVEVRARPTYIVSDIVTSAKPATVLSVVTTANSSP
jgi:glycosyltransferase involved in cell wall biosynthesis